MSEDLPESGVRREKALKKSSGEGRILSKETRKSEEGGLGLA